MNNKKSAVQILVENHSCGTSPKKGEGTLDTPEKVRDYVIRMNEATKKGRELNQKRRTPRDKKIMKRYCR